MLPTEIQDQVREYVQSLLEKRTQETPERLALDWRGALRDLREQYTSLDLEHKALEWWED